MIFQNSKELPVYAFFLRIFFQKLKSMERVFYSCRYKYDKINVPSVIDGLSNQIEVLGIITLQASPIGLLKKFDFNKINNQISF